MHAHLIDGKQQAETVRAEVAAGVQALLARGGAVPGLATVLVGDDPASQVYVRNKQSAAKACGMQSFHHALPATTTTEALLALIAQLNADAAVHGILVQLPLPKHCDADRVLQAVAPHKDVDGFHPLNVARLVLGLPGFVPCTPLGCMRLLQEAGVALSGSHCVVVGRSNIVGKPMAHLLLQQHATVTIAHSRTRDLPAMTRQADVLIAAVGVPKLITAAHVKAGAVVIDVGINRGADGKLVGDVDFAAVAPLAKAITPVPGGVGPMTIAMLLQNTLLAASGTLVY